MIRCASCKKRIRDHEPDLALENLTAGGKPRFYHERCAAAAAAKASERPGFYLFTQRYVDAERN